LARLVWVETRALYIRAAPFLKNNNMEWIKIGTYVPILTLDSGLRRTLYPKYPTCISQFIASLENGARLP
jgi:hypothetical protein